MTLQTLIEKNWGRFHQKIGELRPDLSECLGATLSMDVKGGTIFFKLPPTLVWQKKHINRNSFILQKVFRKILKRKIRIVAE